MAPLTWTVSQRHGCGGNTDGFQGLQGMGGRLQVHTGFLFGVKNLLELIVVMAAQL